MSDIASVLYAREDVRRKVEELGAQITGDYAGRTPVLVSVLKGGAMFLADLCRAIDLPLDQVGGYTMQIALDDQLHASARLQVRMGAPVLPPSGMVS